MNASTSTTVTSLFNGITRRLTATKGPAVALRHRRAARRLPQWRCITDTPEQSRTLPSSSTSGTEDGISPTNSTGPPPVETATYRPPNINRPRKETISSPLRPLLAKRPDISDEQDGNRSPASRRLRIHAPRKDDSLSPTDPTGSPHRSPFDDIDPLANLPESILLSQLAPPSDLANEDTIPIPHTPDLPTNTQVIIPPHPASPTEHPSKSYMRRLRKATTEGLFPLFFTSVRRYLIAGNKPTHELYSLCLQACAHENWKKGQLAWLARQLIEEMEERGLVPTEEDWLALYKAISGGPDWIEREWARNRLSERFVDVGAEEQIRAFTAAEEYERAVAVVQSMVARRKKVSVQTARELIIALCEVDETAEVHRIYDLFKTQLPEHEPVFSNRDEEVWFKMLEAAARTQHAALASLAYYFVPPPMRTEWMVENILYATQRRPYIKLADACTQHLLFLGRLRGAHREAHILTHFQYLSHYPTEANLETALKQLKHLKFIGSSLVQGLAARIAKIGDSTVVGEFLRLAEEKGMNPRIIICACVRAGMWDKARTMIIGDYDWSKREMLKELVESLIAYVGKRDCDHEKVTQFVVDNVLGEVLKEVGKDKGLCIAILELAATLGEEKAVRGLLVLMKEKEWEVPRRLSKVVSEVMANESEDFDNPETL